VAGTPAGRLGRPAIGAAASVVVGGRTLVAQVDGGNGHASARAPELVFGLGASTAARLPVRLVWRDGFGVVRRASLALRPGWHTVVLGQGESP
jgi:hypothetical protein